MESFDKIRDLQRDPKFYSFGRNKTSTFAESLVKRGEPDMQMMFFWKDMVERGIYVFCINREMCDAGSLVGYFQIEEVDVAYKSLKTKARKDRFGDARFVWGGSIDGKSVSDCLMRAQTVEEAKREFEGVYGRMLARRIEDLQKSIETAKEVHKQFLIYVGEG